MSLVSRMSLAMCVSLPLSFASHLQAQSPTERSLFIDRYDFPYTGNVTVMTNEINAMMEDAANEGFTDIIWQVRGRADALYQSNFEPSASGLTPGFDPLQTALDAAHSRGMKVRAWLNATNLWNTNAVTPPSNHIYNNTDPSFRIQSLNGSLEPQSGWEGYSSVNPVLPEVQTHINSVVNDIAENYAVDGIHLDYIRYIPGGYDFNHFPHDPVSHQLFNQATGLDGSNAANFSAYKSFVTGRITDLVESVKATVDAAELSTGRSLEYSASVWRDPDVGKNDYLQDYRTWLENDYFDVIMPMIYLSAANDDLYFNDNLLNTMRTQTNSRVVPVLGTYLHVNGGGGAALTQSEIERAYLMGADGISFYDHPTYFNGYSSADRHAIKSQLDSFTDSKASSPGNPLNDFDSAEGSFDLPPEFSGSNYGVFAGSTAEQVTTEAQAGAGSQKLVIDGDSEGWFLRHLSGGGSTASNEAFASTGFVGFWLKTDDPGLTVQIAIDDPETAERGFLQPVVGDGEWRLYQWNLEDDRQWDGWVSGNGSITGSTVTIDSIQFYGSGDATIFLDSLSHNPNGLLAGLTPIAGDFNGDGSIDNEDLVQWLGDYGTNELSDADQDGDSDGADFLAWQRSLSSANALQATSITIPEPSSLTMLLAGLASSFLWTQRARTGR